MILNRDLALKLARLGAWARMNAIEAELRELRAAFPDLNVDGAVKTASNAPGQRTMSPEARQAMSRRMKKRWKAWRAARASQP